MQEKPFNANNREQSSDWQGREAQEVPDNLARRRILSRFALRRHRDLLSEQAIDKARSKEEDDDDDEDEDEESTDSLGYSGRYSKESSAPNAGERLPKRGFMDRFRSPFRALFRSRIVSEPIFLTVTPKPNVLRHDNNDLEAENDMPEAVGPLAAADWLIGGVAVRPPATEYMPNRPTQETETGRINEEVEASYHGPDDPLPYESSVRPIDSSLRYTALGASLLDGKRAAEVVPDSRGAGDSVASSAESDSSQSELVSYPGSTGLLVLENWARRRQDRAIRQEIRSNDTKHQEQISTLKKYQQANQEQIEQLKTKRNLDGGSGGVELGQNYKQPETTKETPKFNNSGSFSKETTKPIVVDARDNKNLEPARVVRETLVGSEQKNYSPNTVLKAVEVAAEDAVPIESLYEKRHELKDNDTNLIDTQQIKSIQSSLNHNNIHSHIANQHNKNLGSGVIELANSNLSKQQGSEVKKMAISGIVAGAILGGLILLYLLLR